MRRWSEAKPRLLDTRSITTTTAVNIIIDNDDDAAEGEGVFDSGGNDNIDYIDGGGGW